MKSKKKLSEEIIITVVYGQPKSALRPCFLEDFQCRMPETLTGAAIQP